MWTLPAKVYELEDNPNPNALLRVQGSETESANETRVEGAVMDIRSRAQGGKRGECFQRRDGVWVVTSERLSLGGRSPLSRTLCLGALDVGRRISLQTKCWCSLQMSPLFLESKS